MTTRPGAWAQDSWRHAWCKRPCNLVKITRTDGSTLTITDHDRPIDFEGSTYRPIVFAGMSAERREAALRSGNQEAYGLIDANYVLLPDLLGDRYRGAEVAHVITDFELPLLVVARHRKWIRSVTFTGESFVATLEGRTQVLTRPAGGRFGGIFTTTCPYKLGGEFCKVDLNDDDLTYNGVRVDSVAVDRMQFLGLASSFYGSPVDDYFRDGEMQWRWSAPVVSSTCTANTTSTTLTDSTQTWTTNEHVGRQMRILHPASNAVQTAWTTILSNTATTLTFASWAATFLSGTGYDIAGFCENNGHISPVAKYQASNRRIELLFPTPFPIAVGDSGILRVGCDGLKTTCKDKFNNLDNFGGDAEAPSAGKVVKPATG